MDGLIQRRNNGHIPLLIKLDNLLSDDRKIWKQGSVEV